MPVSQTQIESLELIKQGKVRDIYQVTDDQLLLVASDRVSAYDCILPTAIPYKGQVLTRLSAFWFGELGIVSHYIGHEKDAMPNSVHSEWDKLVGRSTLCRKAEVVPIECVVRGYITGSAWRSYTKDGTVCLVQAPEGLSEADSFGEPIFTPTTKAEEGHDEDITFDEVVKLVGEETATELRDRSLDVYKRASDFALSRGLILADTKFEWGHIDGELVLVDEILTPDSSRFWLKEDWDNRGEGSPPSLDKQFVRNYLTSIGFSGDGVPPELPEEVVTQTVERYLDLYQRLTGSPLPDATEEGQ